PARVAARESLYYDIYSQLVCFSEEQQLSGDIWHNYLVGLLARDENPFSLAGERGAGILPGLFQLVIRDMEIIRKSFSLDWAAVARAVAPDGLPILREFQPGVRIPGFYGQNLQALGQLLDLDNGPVMMASQLAEFYDRQGCGLMNRYLAFRWDKGLQGIVNPDPVRLGDLVGYQYQKLIITANTEAFLEGKKANNVLLYGEKGTGKSSAVKAMLNEYGDKGLRMIELRKSQLEQFPVVVRSICERGLRFIIFIDDFSFEDFETEYKNIKASIEGGLEIRPANVLLYVTSNRRNLVKENWSERSADDVHGFDARQEKLSLADRFGITITFPSPDQELFLAIVETLARRQGVELDVEELRRRALQWERNYHGRSGRSAEQFINSLYVS
ncbi:MAG: ATP-binding protein, partial [Syntrophomonadaceae bacterium]